MSDIQKSSDDKSVSEKDKITENVKEKEGFLPNESGKERSTEKNRAENEGERAPLIKKYTGKEKTAADIFTENINEPQLSSLPGKESTEGEKGGYTKEQTEDLLRAYPSLDIDELMQDELFMSFCDGKDGGVSLKNRYEQYKRFTEDFEKKSSYRLAAARASVGSLADTSYFEEAYFTKEQVMAMSPEDIRKNYDAIRKSQNNW